MFQYYAITLLSALVWGLGYMLHSQDKRSDELARLRIEKGLPPIICIQDEDDFEDC